MKQLRIVFTILAAAFLVQFGASAQQKEYDVFQPISKYMAQGDVESLSAWFDDNLEMTVLSKGGESSRAQAKQILQGFFQDYTPRSFTISHTAGKGNMKYALAELYAGGERFLVTVFVSCRTDTYRIQQLKIDRIQ